MSTEELTVAPGNEAQAAAWDGDEGRVWAQHSDFFESATARHRAALAEAAAITPTERVVDIGCGTGASTIHAAQAASASTAVGIDLSSAMIDRARRRSVEQGVTNATFVQGDAQLYRFQPGAFDLAISLHGSMFFADQIGAFANIAGALRTGGRLVLVSWQAPDRNEWLQSFNEALTLGRGVAPPPPDAPSPFSHAHPSRTEQILTAAGFTSVTIDGVELPMRFGASAEEGYGVLSQSLAWMTRELSDDERSEAFARLRASLEQHETPDGVVYGSSAWLIAAQRA